MINQNEKNPMWKGDDVGYKCLHKWVRRHKPKPELCQECNLKPPHDLANISQEYKRDVNDFEWLCRACHMKKDGRLKCINSFHRMNSDYNGEKNPFAKLNNKQVRVIYHLKSIKPRMTQVEVAKIFNTDQSRISSIWRGKTWSKITNATYYQEYGGTLFTTNEQAKKNFPQLKTL